MRRRCSLPQHDYWVIDQWRRIKMWTRIHRWKFRLDTSFMKITRVKRCCLALSIAHSYFLSFLRRNLRGSGWSTRGYPTSLALKKFAWLFKLAKVGQNHFLSDFDQHYKSPSEIFKTYKNPGAFFMPYTFDWKNGFFSKLHLWEVKKKAQPRSPGIPHPLLGLSVEYVIKNQPTYPLKLSRMFLLWKVCSHRWASKTLLIFWKSSLFVFFFSASSSRRWQ